MNAPFMCRKLTLTRISNRASSVNAPEWEEEMRRLCISLIAAVLLVLMLAVAVR